MKIFRKQINTKEYLIIGDKREYKRYLNCSLCNERYGTDRKQDNRVCPKCSFKKREPNNTAKDI